MRRSRDGSRQLVCVADRHPSRESATASACRTAATRSRRSNTDSVYYAGSGVGNLGQVTAEELAQAASRSASPSRCRRSPSLAAPRLMSRLVWPGKPFPLGPEWDGEGTNFSLFSEDAERVELCLFHEDGGEERIEVTAHCFAWHCYLPASARPALRLRCTARTTRVGAPFQPGEAPDRSVREADRRRRALDAANVLPYVPSTGETPT